MFPEHEVDHSLRCVTHPERCKTCRTHGFLDVIDEAAMTFCKKVKQASDGPDKYIDVEPFVQNWSLDVITQAAFG